MTTIRIGADVPLVAGETVVCPRRAVCAGSASSWPTYRLFFSLPPLLEVRLLVTDQRVILHGLCLRLVAQVHSLWFAADAGREQLESVSVGSTAILGNVLELHSIEPTRRWYRSQRMRLRLFVRGADEVAEIIERQMRRSGKRRAHHEADNDKCRIRGSHAADIVGCGGPHSAIGAWKHTGATLGAASEGGGRRADF